MEPLFALRLIARAWLLPPAGLLLLAVVGLWLAGRWPRFGRTLAALGVVTLLALSLPVVAEPLQRAVERYPPLDLAPRPDAAAVVVLAGGVRRGPDGASFEPTAITLERIAHGVEVARRTGLPLAFSGGVVAVGPPEAETMQAAARRWFGTEARWLETRSRTTEENARYTAELLAVADVHRIVLVTTASHMARAVAQFEARGLAVVPAPVGGSASRYDGWTDWLPSIGALQRSSDALRELAGLWVTVPRGAPVR